MNIPISPQQLLGELAAIAFARATDYQEIQDGKLIARESAHLNQAQKAAIASMEVVSGGVRVKLYDKLKALELLGKAMGLFDGSQGVQEHNNLLEAILQATDKEVDVHDLPEVQQAAADCHELVEPAPVEGS